MLENKLKPAIDMVLFLLASQCSKNHALDHLLELLVPFKNSNSFSQFGKHFSIKWKQNGKHFDLGKRTMFFKLGITEKGKNRW